MSGYVELKVFVSAGTFAKLKRMDELSCDPSHESVDEYMALRDQLDSVVFGSIICSAGLVGNGNEV